MLNKNTLLFIALFLTSFCNAQKIISQELYKGKLDNKIAISLYLKIAENGCPNIYANAMYKYAATKNSNYILLHTFLSETKGQFTMVEHSNTGILILKKSKTTLNGIWISTDGSIQIKVELQKVIADSSQINELEKSYDKAVYDADDC
jgi:hypothetical protein